MNIHTDLEDLENPLVQTYGGEDAGTNCAYYGISIDDFSFTVSPEVALQIWQKLGAHLAANNRLDWPGEYK